MLSVHERVSFNAWLRHGQRLNRRNAAKITARDVRRRQMPSTFNSPKSLTH